jgi:hypothetical protein
MPVGFFDLPGSPAEYLTYPDYFRFQGAITPGNINQAIDHRRQVGKGRFYHIWHPHKFGTYIAFRFNTDNSREEYVIHLSVT